MMQDLHSKHRRSMPPATRRIGEPAPWEPASQAALASSWQVCRLRADVTGILKRESPLQAEVLEVTPHPCDAAGPAIGSALVFRPEQADYRNDLRRRAWPKIAQNVRMRYQYLDGICKERRPCRIKHYPVDLPQALP